jgi:hypothetical protein
MRPLPATAIAVVTAAMGVAACGSSGSKDNGVASKPPDQIVASARTAMQSAKSVHVAGSLVSNGQPLTLDLNILSGKGAKGQISEAGLSFQLLASGKTVYIKGSSAFLKHFGGNTAAQVFAGKWLKGSATGQLAAIGEFTNLPGLFNQIVAGHGTLGKGSTTTVDGQKVVGVTDRQKGGTMYVATTGKPFPIELSKSGSGGGRLTFDHYDESVSLTPPSGAIDISQFQNG